MDMKNNETVTATERAHKRPGEENLANNREKVLRTNLNLPPEQPQAPCINLLTTFVNNATSPEERNSLQEMQNEEILRKTRLLTNQKQKQNERQNQKGSGFAASCYSANAGSGFAATTANNATILGAIAANNNGPNSSFSATPNSTPAEFPPEETQQSPTFQSTNDTPMHQQNQMPNVTPMGASHATALQKTRDRAEQKMYEKTRGNRQEDAKKYLMEIFSESHLDKIIQEELLDLAIKNIKCNNLIENQRRNLSKFLKAKDSNPDLPFIPRSASSFTLNGTEAIRESAEFGMLQEHCKKATEDYNKKISELCFSVGLLEEKALVQNRTRNLLQKGLTLAYAFQITRIHEDNMPTPKEPKKTAAYALLKTISENEELSKMVSSDKKSLVKDIEEAFKTYHGTLNLEYMDRTMCNDDRTLTLDVSQHLSVALQTVTVDTWNHLLQLQEERKKKLEIFAGMQELKINQATEATDEILQGEQNVSHKVLTDLINEAVEKKLQIEKKKLQKKMQKNSKGGKKNQLPEAQKPGSILKKKNAKNTKNDATKKVQFQSTNGKHIQKSQRNPDDANKDGRKSKGNEKGNKQKKNRKTSQRKKK